MNPAIPPAEPRSSADTPRRSREWRARLGIAALTAAGTLGPYFLASIVTGWHEFRWPLYLAIELEVPFIPIFSLAYISLYVLMVVAFFAFPSRREMLPLAWTLVFQSLVAAPFFLLVPVEYAFEHRDPTGVAGMVFRFADRVNLEHNMCPSLHVSMAWSTAAAIATRCERIGRIGLFSWSAVITASTVLIHQHYVGDVLGGGILAFISIRHLYPRATRRFDPPAIA